MALEFISPKKRKKVLIQTITGFFVFVLALFSLLIFFRPPKPEKVEEVFTPEEIEIDFETLKSEKVSNLDLFEVKVKKVFDYRAETEDGRTREGRVMASSKEEAEKILKDFELVEIELKEREVGRDNPFFEEELIGVMEGIDELREEFGDSSEFQELLIRIEENPEETERLIEDFKGIMKE